MRLPPSARSEDMRNASARAEAIVTGALLLPASAAFIGLFCYPMLLTLILSLRPEGADAGWTVSHYVGFLSDSDGRAVVLLTFGLALAATVLSVRSAFRWLSRFDASCRGTGRFGS